jgi:exopolysaccharide biosynthesis polyprenyl glycosylphosphotransferase
MIRRHAGVLRALLILADAAVAFVVLAVVYSALFVYGPLTLASGLTRSTWVMAGAYVAMWVLCLYLVGAYRLRAHWTVKGEALAIIRATVWAGLISVGVLFLTDQDAVSRSLLVVLFPTQAVVTIASRIALRQAFLYIRRKGRNVRYMLILGTGDAAVEFARDVEDHTALGLRVMGFVGEPPVTRLRWPYLGQIESVGDILHHNVVDEVAICLPFSEWPQVQEIANECEEEGKIVRIPLDVPALGPGMRFVEDLDGTAVLSLVKGPDRVLGLAAKRLIDVAAAAFGIVLLSPLMIGIAVYIRLRDGSPAIFRQTRIGMHGREFTIYKFRTMVRDAEDRLAAIQHLSVINGPAFKVPDDPRITPWGRMLRRTSLDELPQLFNVLKGEMSLVGPRPAPPREVAAYDLWHRRRLSMKPGITGLWQLSSRSDSDFDERARLDLDYIDRWSLWLDLRIVARTLPAVLQLDGQ